MWKKLKLLFGQSDNPNEDEAEDEVVIFKSNDPIDVLFAKNFNAGGGQFFYCENDQEALEYLKAIVDNENINEVICYDNKLKSFLNTIGVPSTTNVNASEYSFLECEYLDAFSGSIMLSGHQTMGRNLNDFPDNFIIYAHPTQFVSNLSEGMHLIKKIKGNNLPSNITSISGRNKDEFSTDKPKNIFLLLVEQA